MDLQLSRAVPLAGLALIVAGAASLTLLLLVGCAPAEADSEALPEGAATMASETLTPQPETSTRLPVDSADATLADAEAKTATFALGWFWGPDSRFGSLPGVIRTRVGYAGGDKENPTYRSLGGHAETIQIDYDPAQITYEELLDVYWNSHNPASRPWSQQYASIIFYHDEEQKRLAEETGALQAEKLGKQIHTQIIPFSDFTLAEDYHQKYRLQQVPELEDEFAAIYPDMSDFVNSTAAARVNGYVAGYGNLEGVRAEIEALGLSPEVAERLLAIVQGFGP